MNPNFSASAMRCSHFFLASSRISSSISFINSFDSSFENSICSSSNSSLTTIAGFLALCSMNLTLGRDIGIVMAKGVVFGLLCVIVLFPALLLVFDKLIQKTKSDDSVT